MDTRVNFTLVGLYVVILFVGMIALGLWLSQGRHRNEYNFYQVYFQESVLGLTQQAPVKFNGVVVGYVSTIELDHANLQRVRLLLKIEEGVPITETTVATLKTQGITGVTYIGLKALTPNAPPLTVAAGEEYPTIKATPSFLLELTDSVRLLTANLQKITTHFMTIMSEKNQKHLTNSLAHIEQVTRVLSQNSTHLQKSLINLNVLLENTRKASQAFPRLASQADHVLNDAGATLKVVKHAAREGVVLLHDFKQQTLPGANALLEDLEYISTNLRGFSEELRENPAVIIRGKQAKQAGPGE
jgi:phospholipid/cholesterol/gamma-HCH transport system substrate-binding protein